ncbi:MAG: cytochrome c biogenesis protein CcsA [Opitutaceae bacterium]|nr:cytochrome c biogenesis protein CcsA [Opitutaceae bacterium]
MFANFADRTWLWLAAEFYLVGFLLGTWSLLRGGKPLNVATYFLIVAGYVMQLTGLYLRGLAVGGCPLGNTFELFQFTAWSAISLYLVVGVTFRTSLLGYFTSCLAAVLTLVSLAIPAWDSTRSSGIFGNNPWIEFHAALALFSYGVFGLLALTALMLQLRNYSLKNKRIGGWFSFLPSLFDLDQISGRLLVFGVVLLTAALTVGSVHWVQNTATVHWPKLLTTVSVWACYAIALVLRIRGQLGARRFAWTAIILFTLALLTLGVVDANRRNPATPAASRK